MKYATAQAFRQALEERIRREYKGNDIPRIRKMIVFERLMARLDERWILKGGYAIQLRTEKARMKDLGIQFYQKLVPFISGIQEMSSQGNDIQEKLGKVLKIDEIQNFLE